MPEKRQKCIYNTKPLFLVCLFLFANELLQYQLHKSFGCLDTFEHLWAKEPMQGHVGSVSKRREAGGKQGCSSWAAVPHPTFLIIHS